MQTVQRPYVIRDRTRQFSELNRRQKRSVIKTLVDHSRMFSFWDRRGRGDDWARVMSTLEDFIGGSEYRYSIHE